MLVGRTDFLGSNPIMQNKFLQFKIAYWDIEDETVIPG
jgi:hypothetical protein